MSIRPGIYMKCLVLELLRMKTVNLSIVFVCVCVNLSLTLKLVLETMILPNRENVPEN